MQRHTTRLTLGLLLLVASNAVPVTAKSGGPLPRMVHQQFDGGEPPFCYPRACLAEERPRG